MKAGALIFLPSAVASLPRRTAAVFRDRVPAGADRHRWRKRTRKYAAVRACTGRQSRLEPPSVLVGESGDANACATVQREVRSAAHALAEWARLQRGAGTFALPWRLDDAVPVSGNARPACAASASRRSMTPKAESQSPRHSIAGSGGYTTALEMQPWPASTFPRVAQGLARGIDVQNQQGARRVRSAR